MTVNALQALEAYRKAADSAASKAPAGLEEGAGEDFGTVLRQIAAEAVETLKAGEQQSLAAAAGQADLDQVVVAVSRAELTLQTVVAIRDRVIQAYQDILRMPI